MIAEQRATTVSVPPGPKLQARTLGRSCIAVSRIGFGGWGLGGVYYGPVAEAQGVDTVRAYLDAGGNHIDSAFAYHKSEVFIGKAVRGYDRSQVVLVSKSYACMPGQEVELRRQLGVSLRDLGTDYVDVYYLHGPPEESSGMHKVLDDYRRLRDEGLIRAIGVSIKGPEVTDAKVDLARRYIDTGKIDCIQMAYSIFRQKAGIAFREAADAGVGVVARVVYESGILSGRYKPGHTFQWPDQRVRYRPEHRDQILAEVQALAAERLPEGCSGVADLAAAFALANPDITSAVFGAVRPESVLRTVSLDRMPALDAAVVSRFVSRYAHRNDEFNPTGELEHVPSPRE